MLKEAEDGTRRGIVPVIPYRAKTKDKPAYFPKLLYRARARVEQLIGKLQRFNLVAMRYEKTQQNSTAFILLAGVFILIKSAHMV